MRTLITVILSLGALAAAVSSLRAELPPSAYEQMQESASDVFRINVLQVTRTATDDPHTTAIRIVADVTKVKRSTNKVRMGDLIVITYEVVERPPGFVGPGEVPVPKEGSEVPAYLRLVPESSDYAPAAGLMTFSSFH